MTCVMNALQHTAPWGCWNTTGEWERTQWPSG